MSTTSSDNFNGLTVSIVYTERDGSSHNYHGVIKQTTPDGLLINVLVRDYTHVDEEKNMSYRLINEMNVILPPPKDSESGEPTIIPFKNLEFSQCDDDSELEEMGHSLKKSLSLSFLPDSADDNTSVSGHIQESKSFQLVNRMREDSRHFQPIQPVPTNNDNGTYFPDSTYFTKPTFFKQGKKCPTTRKQKNGNKNMYRNARQNADCFGGNVEDMSEDFDFEGNLALFDKKSVFAEIEHDKGRQGGKPRERYFPQEKHDTSNLYPTTILHINDPKPQQQYIFYNNSGGSMMSVPPEIIMDMRNAATAYGFDVGRQNELFAIAVIDRITKLMSATDRTWLKRKIPLSVLVVCGPSSNGAMGLVLARHLAAKLFTVTVMMQRGSFCHPYLAREFALYNLMEHSFVEDTDGIDIDEFSLILLAVKDESEFYESVYDKLKLLEDCPVGAINPPPTGFSQINLNYSFLPAWPTHQSLCNGHLFVANIGIPPILYKEIGVEYNSLFEEGDCVQIFRKRWWQ